MEQHERVAIVGTAQSWALTPWTDPGLYVMSVNDAYRMKGFGRADAWYDLHPMDHFFHVPAEQKQIYAHQIPAGSYVRPTNHLAWLGAQSIPVWLHPDYLSQCPDAAGWVSARPFPKAEIEAAFGRYFTSSPAWMIAHAVLQGVKELHIYGIHLATEHEYIEQRPNFEYLCGRVLGAGRLKTSVHEGIRRYETEDGLIVLPEASPILASNFQYAFESRPRAAMEPLKWEAHKVNIKRERAVTALKVAPWWQAKKPLQDALWRLEAWQTDVQEQLARVEAQSHWTGAGHGG